MGFESFFVMLSSSSEASNTDEFIPIRYRVPEFDRDGNVKSAIDPACSQYEYKTAFVGSIEEIGPAILFSTAVFFLFVTTC